MRGSPFPAGEGRYHTYLRGWGQIAQPRSFLGDSVLRLGAAFHEQSGCLLARHEAGLYEGVARTVDERKFAHVPVFEDLLARASDARAALRA